VLDPHLDQVALDVAACQLQQVGAAAVLSQLLAGLAVALDGAPFGSPGAVKMSIQAR